MKRWPWQLSSEKAWPASGTTVKAGIARLLAEAQRSGFALDAKNAPGIRVSSSAFTPRSRIESFSADFTGATLELDGAAISEADDDWIPDPSSDDVVSRTPGTIDDLRLRADPLNVNGVEVRADLAMTHAPIEWVVVRRNGRLLGTLDAGREVQRRTAGSFRVSVAQADLAALVLGVIQSTLKGSARWSASAKDLKLAVTPSASDARRFVVTIGAKGRVFVLPLSARVGFDVSVADSGEITVHRATAASKSLLSKLILLPLRPQLRELAGRRYPVASTALALSGVTIDAAAGRLSVTGDIRPRAGRDA